MENKKISRKNFLKKTAITGIASGIGLSGCNLKENSSPANVNINFNKVTKWKMVTTWPPNFPVVGEGCTLFADWVREMSGGRLDIKVYGGGELVPALEAFEAVMSGAAEIGHGASYYWTGKAPSTVFFATIPFGMNVQQMNAWMYAGGGSELHRELYKKFNLIPFPAGGTGVQMAGWFNKELNEVKDFKGLKMRIPGMGAKVLQEMGGTAVLSSGNEIYTNLERGVIDATEWIGPYHDYLMGFHKIAKYYYYPGWHEPGPILEFFINQRDFNNLSKDLQVIVETAAARLNIWSLSEFESKNNLYLKKIKAESTVDVRPLSQDILSALKKASQNVIQQQIDNDPFSKKVYESYNDFRKNISEWSAISEKQFYNSIQAE